MKEAGRDGEIISACSFRFYLFYILDLIIKVSYTTHTLWEME